MTKNKEWLKNKVNELPLRFLGFSVLKQREEFAVIKDDVLDLIDQLDEPEVLSQEWIQEWIDKNQKIQFHEASDTADYFVGSHHLQNLLVPKQERITLKQVINRLYELEQNNQSLWINRILHEFGRVFGVRKHQEGYEQGRVEGIAELNSDEAVTINYTPTIPQFVGKYIEIAKKDKVTLLESAGYCKRATGELRLRRAQEWGRDNFDTFARAWLDGFTVEEEQKYNVNFKFKSSYGTVGIFLYKIGDEVLAGDNFRAYYPKEDEYRLTEQEIRGFQNGDILFEHFAVKVEELEE